jgi:hypothetical protein
MKKRILLLFTVALVMAAMMMAMGAQAFAVPPGPPSLTGAGQCADSGCFTFHGSGTNITAVEHSTTGGGSCVRHFEGVEGAPQYPITKSTGAGC